MYLQKDQIKSSSSSLFLQPLPQEPHLSSLFTSKKIPEFLSSVSQSLSLSIPVSPQALSLAAHFKSILEKQNRANAILNSSKNGWKINKIDSRTELAVKVTGTNVQLRYEGILETNIENLCIMIYQVNLFANWVPFCTKGEDIGQVSPMEKICYLQFKMPFLAQRYAYFYGLGIDRISQNGTIVIYGEGITQNEQLMKKYNIQPNYKKLDKMVVMDLKFFICQISYKSDKEFLFRCYSQLDSRMPILPEWIVNAVIKQMGGFIFDRIIKQSQNFKGSVWEKQMQVEKDTNPFYSWLHKRIQTWLELKRKQGMTSKF